MVYIQMQPLESARAFDLFRETQTVSRGESGESLGTSICPRLVHVKVYERLKRSQMKYAQDEEPLQPY